MGVKVLFQENLGISGLVEICQIQILGILFMLNTIIDNTNINISIITLWGHSSDAPGRSPPVVYFVQQSSLVVAGFRQQTNVCQ